MKDRAYSSARVMRRLLGVLMAAAAILALSGAAIAQECDLPLFVTQGNIDPNVMIVFDNSGSMNEAMFHPDFDPSVTYTGSFQTDTRYYISRSGWYEPRDFNNHWASTPSAYLVQSDRGENGRYVGNYLNWIYFHASDTQRANIPLWTRIQVAKVVMTDVIQRTGDVRFGLTIYDYEDGGHIIAPCGTDKATLVTAIWNIAGTTWTPLGETLEDLLNYFSRTDANAPIQAHCQKSFLVIMTDGLPTMDLDVSSYIGDQDGDNHEPGNCQTIGADYPLMNLCSDYMDDVAYYMRHHDLRPDLGTPGESADEGQNVATYAIGFGMDASLLRETAENGDGLYFTADDASGLWISLNSVFADVINRAASGSAVAIVSSEMSGGNALYRTRFMPGTWQGFLEAFSLPYQDGASPLWEAGSLLAGRNPDSRQIFTGLGSTPYNFDVGSAGSLASAMATVPLHTEDVINWIRGESVQGFRDRDGWVLGDMVHSSPVVVGPPSSFYPEEDYQAFMSYYSNRPQMVYIGANDGMLHAFYADSGSETWAFVPEFALPTLKNLVYPDYCHSYTCDQTVSVNDIKVDGAWRTVLMAGGREGGAGYFALDVTEPSSPELMWQASLPSGRPFGSEVEFTSIDHTPVALIGSGLENGISKAYLYAYNIETGDLLGSRLLSTVSGRRNKTSRPRAVDVDLDGQADVIYCTDMAGHVWRAQTNGSPDPTSWDVSALFTGTQTITVPPVPAFGEANKIYVYFGTGAYLDENDLADTSQNTIYCVYDSHDGAAHAQGDLVDQTSQIHDIGDADGWYVDLIQAAGERVTEKAVVAAGTVFFTSFVPTCEPCTAGGESWLYRLAYDDASAIENQQQGGEYPRVEELGDGIASAPVVDVNSGNVVVQSSDVSITVTDLGSTFFPLNVRSWQENYDFTEVPADSNQVPRP